MDVPGRWKTELGMMNGGEITFFMIRGYHDWVDHLGIIMIALSTWSSSIFVSTGHIMLKGGNIYINLLDQDTDIASIIEDSGSGFHDA